ncbi:MAG: repressor LexA [Candidatus Cloacimonetes bacterium HGW-Cloacimonetes-2]|jgi:SOS-response transcriptional repressor LexA|nr:MAG: repressor LexA [Candidatus Cloacimonetes bacterium HGW-Cloacimonetes-2]
MTGERFRQLRKELGLSQIDLSDKLGVNPSAISQMESGRIRPSLDTMMLLSKNYGINLHWLITGRGDMYENTGEVRKPPAKAQLTQLQEMLNRQLKEIVEAKSNLDDTDVIDIPVTGEIAAGPPVESAAGVLDVISIRRSMIQGVTDDFMCLRVNGQSMEPEIRNNDVILIRPSNDWNQLSGKICAVRVDGSITLKKMVLDYAKKLIFLLSLNDEYQPIVVNPEEHQDISLLGYIFFLFRKVQ